MARTGSTGRAAYRVPGSYQRQRRSRGFALIPGFARRIVRGRWLLISLLVLLAAAVMVGLGFWQLGRLQGRRAANTAIMRQMNAPPLALDATTVATTDPASLTFRHVTVRGSWDYAHEVELRYRTYDGQAGVHILTPLRIDGSEQSLLVDRGWIPYQAAGPEGRRAYQADLRAAVEGLVYESHRQENRPGEAGTFSQVDLAAIGAQQSLPLLPYWVKRLPTGDNRTLPYADDPPALDNGPHLGYMVQWWAFAATLLITYVIFANQAMLRERQRKQGAGSGVDWRRFSDR